MPTSCGRLASDLQICSSCENERSPQHTNRTHWASSSLSQAFCMACSDYPYVVLPAGYVQPPQVGSGGKIWHWSDPHLNSTKGVLRVVPTEELRGIDAGSNETEVRPDFYCQKHNSQLSCRSFLLWGSLTGRSTLTHWYQIDQWSQLALCCFILSWILHYDSENSSAISQKRF